MRAAAHPPAAHADEVARGDRFEFGENWRRFLSVLDDERIAAAERSLREMLGVESLDGRRFLDIGSGSGLFSLAARRLGAERVHSFDFDPESVACTRELKRRYFPDDPGWTVEEGNVLDEEFVAGLGTWDVVYSWGVLHHTGDMWRALGLALPAVTEGGLLFVAIYNDQGPKSRLWRAVKRLYNQAPAPLQPVLAAIVMSPMMLVSVLLGTIRGRKADSAGARGMSRWHDAVDWIGGYPFEVAKPEQVFDFVQRRGFRLERLTTCGGYLGCNQYVFCRAR
jgi:2-polyprenyl-6-hydroxyphenyl methylase/3-demethylubiquinone-9 3-methyltransferase